MKKRKTKATETVKTVEADLIAEKTVPKIMCITLRTPNSSRTTATDAPTPDIAVNNARKDRFCAPEVSAGRKSKGYLLAR